MKKISVMGIVTVPSSALVSCSTEMNSPAPTAVAVSMSTTQGAPFAVPEDIRLPSPELRGLDQSPVAEGDRVAAMAVYAQFQGTRISDLELREGW